MTRLLLLPLWYRGKQVLHPSSRQQVIPSNYRTVTLTKTKNEQHTRNHFAIMKLSLILLTILVVGPTALVSAETMVRFVFNDGRAPSYFEGTSCSSSENALIDTIFDLKKLLGLVRRRQLHTSLSNTTSVEAINATGTESRELYPRKCKNNCAGLATGTCRATDCLGYRRRELGDKRNGDRKNRDLQEMQCPALVELMHSKLDLLQISSSCRKFLDKTKRVTTCFDDVIYGEIEGVRLWKVSYFWSTVLQERMASTGYSFCKSTSFNLESINNDCVESAYMELTGPNNYRYTNYQTNAPYTLFNDLGFTMLGQRLSTVGEYTLSITPDGFDYKKKTFKFTLKSC